MPLLSRRKEGCRFCGASRETGFEIVWECDDFVAFRDRTPASLHHIQLVPRIHIESVHSLGPDDAALVRTMKDIGTFILDSLNVPKPQQKMGFHIPPYISVKHLHLHIQALPYNSIIKSCKYPVFGAPPPFHKGFSWFVEVNQAIAILESGGKIGIWPC
ncbi:HIT-like protein [Flagelloscypha sp. PMI_526]|nr:HIT-like protein [Flagelloscypha sp. PMI_526]